MPAGTVMPDSRDGNARPALPLLNNEGTSVMKTLIIAFAILGAAPALTQNPLTTTQSPPAGNSSVSVAPPPCLCWVDGQLAFTVAHIQGISSSMRACGQPLTKRVSRSLR